MSFFKNFVLFLLSKEYLNKPSVILITVLRMVKGIQLALAEQGQILHTILDGGKGRSASNTRISMELQKFTFPLTNTVELEKLNDMVKSSDVAKGDLVSISFCKML